MDYSLVNSQIVFETDDIIEILEDFIEEYILIEHYFDEQLIEAQIVYFEDVEVDYEAGPAGKFFKTKYVREDPEEMEFSYLLRNNFATNLYINGAQVEIELENGRMVGFIGSRGEFILRTGEDSYVFSALYNLKIPAEDVAVLLQAVLGTLSGIHDEVADKSITSESFAMISGVCLMAISKINELPLNNFELYLSHDEMLLLGLALNLANESTDQNTQKIIRSVMEQIKSYFPEIEHISPESFEAPNMGKLLDFKKPEK